MSKERELLERWVMQNNFAQYYELREETVTFLAQPEQTEQEPVAWMYEYAVRSSFDASFTGEWKEEMSRSEPDGTVKGFNPSNLKSTVRNLTPLYTAPKREPIEDGALEVWYSQHTWAMDKQEYVWGFRDAEKCYGITEGGE
jgi:hypothetical protein